MINSLEPGKKYLQNEDDFFGKKGDVWVVNKKTNEAVNQRTRVSVLASRFNVILKNNPEFLTPQ